MICRYLDPLGYDIVDSKKLEYACRVICTGVPSFCCFGIRGRSYSNFLALQYMLYMDHEPF